VQNHLNFLHGILAFAIRRAWATTNPVALVERPRAHRSAHRRVRFLQPEELEAVLRAVPADALGALERPLYLTAAMTGLRQGELLALRWSDVDWTASRVRVAESFTRVAFDSPKSHRGRSVPMADRLAGELERHFQRSHYRGDHDLVFAHPATGRVLDASKLRNRFRAALARAGVRDVTFHELRHTFGTQMAAAGAPLRAIQEWMDHADASTTEIYAHYAPDPTGGRHVRAARVRRRRADAGRRRRRFGETAACSGAVTPNGCRPPTRPSGGSPATPIRQAPAASGPAIRFAPRAVRRRVAPAAQALSEVAGHPSSAGARPAGYMCPTAGRPHFADTGAHYVAAVGPGPSILSHAGGTAEPPMATGGLARAETIDLDCDGEAVR
jgi:site-specific recombinase XerD